MSMSREIFTRLATAIVALVLFFPLPASSTDPNAGRWQMIVLNAPTQINVAAPLPTSEPAYQAELAAIKNAQAQITDEQRRIIEYWGHGGVLRWNEILLELGARYNLPPAPRPDDTYPVPDANNPFADPQFPFGNPPYAARAYSYVAVAQFEALKVAWHYKYLYNRPSPSRVDNGIQALIPTGDLPAYPSEDAVLSGVTAELLKLLFPASVEQITRTAGEQRQAALLAGKATASDIAAGLALGQAVAAVFIARAGLDGLRTAGATPAQIRAMADATAARGEIPWQSLEIPPRPGMLPFFGNVQAWMMTATDVVNERPGPPPSTRSDQMAREVEEVRQTLLNLTRSQLAIAFHWNDGVNTPAPPGHWNFIAAEYIREAQFSEVRAARAFALLNMAMHDASVGCWNAKYFYFNPRPSQLDPRIRTVIGLPNFPSYPSGHSTYSGAATEVLSYLFPSAAATFAAQRDEAGISRLYGGIHYRSDIDAGKDHGKRIGGYTLRFAQRDGADGVAPAGPAVFTLSQDAILNQDSSLNSVDNAAAQGSVIQIFATVLGATNFPPQATERATQSAMETTAVEVSIGGQPAVLQFAGPAPGFPDLYQINVIVPAGIETGSEIELTLTENGVASNTVTIAVR